MNYFTGFLIFILSITNLKAQENNPDFINLNKAYDQYFEIPRESVYLHLNKSSYLRGENIWFQGYAYNRKTKRLNPFTKNIELGIYDDNGKLLDKKLFLAKNGLFKGQVLIDSTFVNGNYYLRAMTNYMKNFKEDYAHIQQFEIIGEDQFSATQSLESYDLQILPEGGHSVVNCSGHLGLKLINSNGVGIKFKGELFENDVPVMNFQSNQFGLAKVQFSPKIEKTYQIEVILPNGKRIKQTIENIKPYGYVLNVNNLVPNNTIIQISANFPEDFDYNNSKVSLMVHQEGEIFFIPLYFAEDLNRISKILSKDQLFKGVNTLTLFVNKKPVAERLIFNNKNILDNSDDVEIRQKDNVSLDSLNYEVLLSNIKTTAEVSISVLPKNTISNEKNKNISSEFLLEPFVNGYIENKTYYFKNSDRKVSYNLDLLLLTQGWSQYSWDNILSGPPESTHQRVDGLSQEFTITGRIKKKIDELIIFNTIHNDGMAVKVRQDSAKTFRLYHRYPVIGEKIEFSFTDKKMNFIKPELNVKTELQLQDNNLESEQLQPPISNLRDIKIELRNEELYGNVIGEQKLDTVFLTSKAKKEKNAKYNYIKNYKDNTLKVTEEVANTYFYLADYLVTKGYLVTENNFDSNRGRRFQIRGFSRTSINADQSPAVFLDGVRLTDLVILSGARMSDFEEVEVDRSGFNMGVQGANGVIRLERRRTPIFTKAYQGLAKEELLTYFHTVQQGFEPSKMFYTPAYAFSKLETFEKVGTIAWFSNLTIQVNKSIEIQIPKTGVKDFTFFIEGITDDGSLINIEKIVEQ